MASGRALADLEQLPPLQGFTTVAVGSRGHPINSLLCGGPHPQAFEGSDFLKLTGSGGLVLNSIYQPRRGLSQETTWHRSGGPWTCFQKGPELGLELMLKDADSVPPEIHQVLEP